MRIRYQKEEGPAEVVSPSLNNNQNISAVSASQRRRIDIAGASAPRLQPAKTKATVVAGSAELGRVEIVVYKFGRRRIRKPRL